MFFQSPAVEQYKIVKRYIIQISSYSWVIFKHRGNFVVVVLDFMYLFVSGIWDKKKNEITAVVVRGGYFVQYITVHL